MSAAVRTIPRPCLTEEQVRAFAPGDHVCWRGIWHTVTEVFEPVRAPSGVLGVHYTAFMDPTRRIGEVGGYVNQNTPVNTVLMAYTAPPVDALAELYRLRGVVINRIAHAIGLLDEYGEPSDPPAPVYSQMQGIRAGLTAARDDIQKSIDTIEGRK